MTSYVTPKKNAAFVTYVSLEDQANAGLFKASPTLAAGDFKVSIDGGALANLATLPTNTPASSTMVKISLSADEMNGDNITVVCKDAAGAEWYDLVLNIQTSARQVDDLAYPATSGRSLTVAATGEASANVTMQAGVAVAAADGNGNVPVVLYGTQPAVTFGQVKILANVNNEGALHIVNSASGNGIGQYSYGDESGQTNDGVYSALRNVASYGVAQYNYSPGGNVSGVDPSGIRAALGMSAANLDAQLDAIGGLTAQDVADALLLAPAGVAAAGSAMAKLDGAARPGDPMTIARRP